jgi:hypothetical protein
MFVLVRTCSDCGAESPGPEMPCAACRSTRQTVSVTAQAATVRLGGAVTGISVSYAPSRPWYESWHAVRQQLASAEATLLTYRGNDLVKREFENFFTVCLHLGDWLWEDRSTGLTRAQVRSFVDSDPALRVCLGVANTTKHHTRSQPGAMTARITSISSGGHGASATIGWTEGTKSGTEDVLSLAKRCVAAWERYLAANGLQSPI